MSDSANYIILNGSCIAGEKAMIPAVTSGLYYGVGCFETFPVESGSIFRFDDHIARLNRGLEYLGISNGEKMDEEILLGQIKTLLEKNDLLEKRSRIRIQVSFAEKKGYSGKGNSSIIVIISANPAKKQSTSKKLVLSETSVVPSTARPAELKLSNMLHYRQAFREAERKGADDAIMITVNGFVAESSIANIFWMKDQTVFTPSEDCEILPGIMRDSILEILRNRMQTDVKEGRFSIDELLKAEIVWLTNSIIDIAPVSQIENVSFRMDNPFISELRDELNVSKKEQSRYV